MKILREAIPEIVGGLVVVLFVAVTDALTPELRLPAKALPIVLIAAILVGRRIYLSARKRVVRRKLERQYLNSVVTRYHEWRQRYLDLHTVEEPPPSAPPDDVTLHPVMHLLLREQDESHTDGEGSGSRDRRVETRLSEAVEEYDRLILLGEPGAGKSTCLQWLALNHAQRALECHDRDSRIPILVKLSSYTGQETAREFLKSYLLDEHGPSGAFLAEHLEWYLSEGRLLVLFDGLNEMPGQGYEVRVGHLRSLATDKWKCKVVISCRTLDYDRRFSWPTLAIQRLNDSQLEAFVDKHLPSTGTDLMRELKSGDPAILDIARNPFMLRTITVIYSRDTELPPARARLTDEFVRVLLAREWRDQWQGDLGIKAVTRCLAKMAFATIKDGRVGTAIDTHWAETDLAAHMQEAGDQLRGITSADMLKLAADASILDIPAHWRWVRYSHELIQEYFAALVLRDQWHSSGSLQPYISDCWWETNVAMACALIDSADDFVLSLLGELQSDGAVILAGRCCVEARGLLQDTTVDAVVRSLLSLSEVGLGPLGMRAMDLVAQIDYATIERLLAEPDPESHLSPQLQQIHLLGVIHAPGRPLYLGPFNFAPRDREWEPRAYAAAIIRECGSDPVVDMLTGFLAEAQSSVSSHSVVNDMAAGALADIAPSEASDLFVRLLGEGSSRVRAHAARGLGNIGAPQAVPLLSAILVDSGESFEVRSQSAAALANIQGVDALSGLLNETADPTLQVIVAEEVSDREPYQPSSAANPVEMEVEQLVVLQPEELLGRMVSVFADAPSWVPAIPYPIAAALALTADEAFMPRIKAALESYTAAHYKLREAIWWIEDAVRARRRRRGRPPQLSPSPRDWSTFGAWPR